MPDPRACVHVRPSDGGRKREERLVEAGRAKGVLIMQGPSYLTDVLELKNTGIAPRMLFRKWIKLLFSAVTLLSPFPPNLL